MFYVGKDSEYYVVNNLFVTHCIFGLKQYFTPRAFNEMILFSKSVCYLKPKLIFCHT